MLWYFKRSVQLAGEAYFEVEKGKKIEVVSEKAKTVVLGTKFLVTARNNEYTVDCKSGKVKVIEAVHKNETTITASQKAELKANHQFKVSAKANVPEKVEPVAEKTGIDLNEKKANNENHSVEPKKEVVPEKIKAENKPKTKSDNNKTSQPAANKNKK